MNNAELKDLLYSRLNKEAALDSARKQAQVDIVKENPEYVKTVLTELFPNMFYSSIGGALIGAGAYDTVTSGGPDARGPSIMGLGAGILAGVELLPYLISKMTAKRTKAEQKAYEKSTGRKLANLLPGVAAYNKYKSGEYYDALIDEKLKAKQKA